MTRPFLGDGKIITGANVLCIVRIVLAILTAQLILGKIIDPVADKVMILLPTTALLWTLYRDSDGNSLAFQLLAVTLTMIVLRETVVFLFKRGLAKRHGIESAIESARASMALQSSGFLLLVWAGLTSEPVATFAAGLMLAASLVAGWDYFTTWRRSRREDRQSV